MCGLSLLFRGSRGTLRGERGNARSAPLYVSARTRLRNSATSLAVFSRERDREETPSSPGYSSLRTACRVSVPFTNRSAKSGIVPRGEKETRQKNLSVFHSRSPSQPPPLHVGWGEERTVSSAIVPRHTARVSPGEGCSLKSTSFRDKRDKVTREIRDRGTEQT